MSETRFTKDHEYIRLDGESATIGITDYAQHALGDVVFVELPKPGAQIASGAQAAVVESVKAASEVYAPASGEITAINDALEGEPGAVNEDPLGRGWFFRMKLASRTEFDGLMDEAAYAAYVATLS